VTVRELPTHLHFVGIGGVGMSAIACVLARRGHRVSGSDCAESAITRHLAERGVRVHIGHAAGNVNDAEVVLVSTAIREDNPEVAEARRRGVPIWHRAEALAMLIDASEGIAIAGTHGKTTTTGMAAAALDAAGLDPTVLVGGVLPEYGGTAKVGRGAHVVAEADESDGSLIHYHPLWAVVTNIDLDHMDHYRDEAHLMETFERLLRQVRPEGGALLWHDDPRLARLRAGRPCRLWTYSARDPQADYFIADLALSESGSAFQVLVAGQPVCAVKLRVPGEHNALNATAIVALCHRMGLDLGAVSRALAKFPGVSRRFQRKGEAREVTVIDDYAHHPTEIRATLTAARTVHPGGRNVVVFQPHRYTRTQHLWREFAEVLSQGVDDLVLMDIYGAGEPPIEGVSARLIFDALPGDKPAARAYCPGQTEAVEHLRRHVRPGDWVFTLGAGNVYRVGEALLEELSRKAVVPA
jgi:UDP-N-acetylmuramate--alanine ligase